MIKILIFIFSFSIRTANLENCPADYEFQFGLSGKNNKAVFLYERERGEYYKGNDRFEFVEYVKTAKKMNYQRFSAIGIVLGLEKWSNADGLASVKYKNKYIKLLYAKGIEQNIIELDILYEHKLTKRISIIPLAKLRKHNDNLFWQYKIVFNFNLRGNYEN